MTGQGGTLGSMDTPRATVTDWAEALRRRGIDPAAVPQGPPAAGLPETAEDRAERIALQTAARRARWERRMPVMYRDASLAGLGAEQHAQTVADWVTDPGSATLLLAGEVGTGKTHAAYAAGHALVASGHWVEAWTLADLLEALRPGGDVDALEAVRTCDVLLLDDLTATKVSDWAVEQFTSLMDHRLRMLRRQIVTTNVGHADLTEAWGHRALDRLAYRWTVCQFTGTSRRVAAW